MNRSLVHSIRSARMLLPLIVLLFARTIAIQAQTAAPPAVGTCSLTINVTGLHNAQGAVRIKITRDGKVAQGGSAAINEKTLTASAVMMLPKGIYSVSLFHDENGNGKLDRNLLGMPTEGYGFSNNPPKKIGAPKDEESVFKADQDRQSIEIRLVFWP